MTAESQNGDVPSFLAKKVPFLPNSGWFLTKNDGASPFWLSAVTEPNYPLDPTQNYNRTLAFLKIPPSGQDIGPFPKRSATKMAKKRQTVLKKGGKEIVCQPKLICVLDAKFDANYDSAIKHDLTQ